MKKCSFFATSYCALVLLFSIQTFGQTEMTNTCKFTSGPREGESERYAQLDSLPVGVPCHDGRGSRGITVSEKRRN